MKYAVEMGSGDMMYIPSLRHSIVDRGIHRHTDSMKISYVYFYFSKIRKVG
jgi:hypothetical protein